MKWEKLGRINIYFSVLVTSVVLMSLYAYIVSNMDLFDIDSFLGVFFLVFCLVSGSVFIALYLISVMEYLAYVEILEEQKQEVVENEWNE